MEAAIECAAKKLVSEYLKANSDYELISDREQKAELRKEIELRRAHRNDLQRIISGLTILKYGIQLGSESANVQASIIQQNHVSVRTMMEKHRAQLAEIASGTKSAPTLSDILQTRRDRMEEARLREVLQCQEQLFAKIRNSRVVLQLERAKEEALKAQQSLETTENGLRLLREKIRNESEQMLQNFTDVAIQIGEEQERFQQNRELLDTAAKFREARHGSMDYIGGEKACPPESSDVNGSNASCTFIGRSDEQQKEGEDTFAGVRLSFSNVDEEFPFEFAFKNPNDFPEILKRISSPRDYETMVKDIAKSSGKDVQFQCADEKGIIPFTVHGIKKKRRLSIIDVEQHNGDSCAPTPDEPSFQAKRDKKMVAPPHGPQMEEQQYIAQTTNQGENVEEQIDLAVVHDSSNGNEAKRKENQCFGLQENVSPTNTTDLQNTTEKIQERELHNRSEQALKYVRVQVSDINKKPPHVKRLNATPIFANQQQNRPSSVREQKKTSSTDESFNIPVNVVSVKQAIKLPQKAPTVNTQTRPATPAPKRHRQSVDSAMPQEMPKKLRNLPSRLNKPPSPASAQSTLRKRKQHKKQEYAADPGHSSEGAVATDIDESLLQPAEASLSNDSLDFAPQSSSTEFDVNLSAEFNDVDIGGNDLDEELDFLMNDDLPRVSAQKKKATKGGDGDSFNFDFDAQNSNENMDEDESDFF